MTSLARALVVFIIAVLAVAGLAQGQDTPALSTDQCADVRYLMAQEITPYNLGMGGGILSAGLPTQSGIDAGDYGDVWSVSIQRPTNDMGGILDATLDITFADATPGLEMAVFQGMSLVPDDTGYSGFRPIRATTAITYTFRQSDIYTLVVRRIHVADQTPIAYTITAQFNEGTPIAPSNLRDVSTGSALDTPPQLVGGVESITLPGSVILIHPDAVLSVAGYNGNATQLRYGLEGNNYGLYLNGWADRIAVVGGDLALNGTTDNGGPQRIFYLENFGFRVAPGDGDLLNFSDSNGTHVQLSWDILAGVWITEECAGFRLMDGRTFTAFGTAAERDVIFRGDLTNFTISLLTPDASGTPVRDTVTLGWAGVADASELRLNEGIFHADLLGGRSLSLESPQIDMRRQPVDDDRSPENQPLLITLGDRQATLTLDWVNLQHFALTDDTLLFTFSGDDPARDTTVRSAANLLQLDAQGDVIHIVYKDEDNGDPGAQRLLLPADDSYVEIVTDSGFPAFDARALPGQDSYAPRGLNNTGGECYPVNTTLAQANCPPNGDPNPANGNLWYSVSDYQASGGLIDLALTRSYNSASAAIDGPFGMGWTNEFLLDYVVPFNDVADARTVTKDDIRAYPVGLDLIWAPRGIVTFTTFSGSRHVFTAAGDDFIGGELTALTMPGWRLSRADVRDSWTLHQPDGLTYEFDRAGRLVRYGYPVEERVVTINYDRRALNGPDESTPVIISDTADQRQLELYYDTNHHIVRSVLRDLTAAEVDFSTCSIAQRCFETAYSYEEGRLSAVTYPDGQRASYDYDEAGRLTAQHDPRAPLAQHMAYAYDDSGQLVTASIVSLDGDSTLWRRLEYLPGETDSFSQPTTRVVTVTDENGAQRTYRYALDGAAIKEVGSSYTLTSQTSPLAETEDDYGALPDAYGWQNGLLQSTQLRILPDNRGRNTLNYAYAPNGSLASGSGGYPALNISTIPSPLDPNTLLPERLLYPDSTQGTLTYDPVTGWLASYTDRLGGEYRYTWSANHRLTRLERVNDGTVSEYEYNALGLVIRISRYLADEDPASAYAVIYRYDGLGRLTEVDDPLTGTYQIYHDPPVREDVAISSTIRIIDATSSQTTLQFNGRGQIIQNQTYAPAGERLLNRTTYTYDDIGRLLTETRWMDIPDPDPAVPITTRYSYEGATELTPLLAGESTTIINGYRVSITDSFGRRTLYTYDGLGRIRQTEEPFGIVRRYDYRVSDTNPVTNDPNDNGMVITGREVRNGRLVSTSTYVFNVLWQLRSVQRQDAINGGTQVWSLNTLGVNNYGLDYMLAREVGASQTTFGDYVNGRPTSVDVAQAGLGLVDNLTPSRPSALAQYDFLNRPLSITDGEGGAQQIAYCPQSDGVQKVVYGLPNVTEDDLCASTEFTQAVFYDAAGRISRVEDEYGIRTYTYTIQPGQWRVDVAFAQGGTNDAWALTYDGAGNLIRFEDDNSFQRSYAYDSLGNLLSLTASDGNGVNAEASLTFRYDERGLLVEALDGVGRGTIYAYNDQGQLTVEQDARTGAASIYGYDAAGQLTTVISPLGSTTTYQYDALGRLTGIVGPTGSTSSFEWRDVGNLTDDDPTNNQGNQLVYTDARGNQTIYTFDSFGALWRIVDSLGRAHELDYDDAGRLVAWQQAYGAGGIPFSTYGVTYDDAGLTVSNDEWSRSFGVSPYGGLESVSTGLDFSYDPLGRLSGITAPDRSWTLDYENRAPALTYTDDSGQARTLRYDALNRLVSDETDDAATTYSYEPGRSAAINLTVEGINTRTYTFSPGDSSGAAPTVTLSAPGQRVTYVYDADGQLEEIRTETCIDLASLTPPEDTPDYDCITDSGQVLSTSERFLYDVQGRPIRYIDPEDNIATFAYDDTGNLTTYQNVNGQTFNYAYDEFNRLSFVTGPTGIRLLLDYDAQDRVSGICLSRAESRGDYAACAGDGNVLESYTYDTLGRLITQTYPNEDATAAVEYTYEDSQLAEWQLAGTSGVALEHDASGLVTGIDLSIDASSRTTYDLTYDGTNRLSTAGDVGYTYDDYGRLATVAAGDHTLAYDYDADLGYTLRDVDSGAALNFALDTRGLLAAITYDGTASAAVTFDYFLSPDNRTLIVQIHWNTGELAELQLNRRGETLNIAYTQNSLFIDYTSDPSGQTQRRGISGLQQYFVESENGYIMLIGYDNDGRPLTMRVTGRSSGQLLYLLSFTYDSFGRRVAETRRYEDGRQITITYHYDFENNRNQLTSREYSSTPSTRTQSAAPFLLPLLGTGWLLRSRRRRMLVFGTIAGMISALTITFTLAQQSGDFDYAYVYSYDAAGNIARIDVTTPDARNLNQANSIATCALYRYDSAGRLIRADFPYSETSRAYSYDAYNRLASAGDDRFAYIGDTDRLVVKYDADGNEVFYGQTADDPGFFQTGNADVTWLLNDGRSQVVAALIGDQITDQAWLFDPLGRFLPLEDTSTGDESSDLCRESAPPESMNTLSPLQILRDDMVWDAASNLYFVNGRAYSPQIGRFLQRDPRGPDAFGNVYSYPYRQAAPPVVERPPAYIEGLAALRDAQRAAANATLTQSELRAAFYPSPLMTAIEPLIGNLDATARITQNQLARSLDYVTWARSNYNLPAPYIDAQGALRLPTAYAPGQGGLPGASDLHYPTAGLLDPINIWLPQMTPPLVRLESLYTAAQPQDSILTSYQPYLWLPTLPQMTDAWTVQLPRLSVEDTPDAIWNWLPQTLTAPENAARALDAVTSITALPTRSGQSWIDAALNAALPDLPPDLPQNGADWLDTWFTTDTLGVADTLASRWPELPPVNVPTFGMGVNPLWSRPSYSFVPDP